MDHADDILFPPPGDEHYESAVPQGRWPRLTHLAQAMMILSVIGILICLQILAWNHV